MGATRFFKNYTQEACEQALRDGYDVGVIGDVRPATDRITIPHLVQEVGENGKIIGYNITKIYLSQSDNWDKYFSIIKEKPGERIVDPPFSVEWPKRYLGKKYQIILVSGKVLEASVDDSRKFMNEGLEWKTEEGNKNKQVVTAWKQLQ